MRDFVLNVPGNSHVAISKL